MKRWTEALETIKDLDKALSHQGKKVEGYLVGGIAFRYLLEEVREEGEVHDYRETNDIDIVTDDYLTIFDLAENYNLHAGRNGFRMPTGKIKETRMINPENPKTYVDFLTDHPLFEDLEREKDLTIPLNDEYKEIKNLELYIPNPDQILRNKKKAHEDKVTRSENKRKHDLEDGKILESYKLEIIDVLKEQGHLPDDYEPKDTWPELKEMDSMEYDNKANGTELENQGRSVLAPRG